MISWVDSNLAVGDVEDAKLHQEIRREGIQLVLDIRNLFEGVEGFKPIPTVHKVAKLLMDLSIRGWKILIYCHGGIDRSPFVAMLYVYYKYVVNYAQAYTIVKHARPQLIEHFEWLEEVR